MDRKMKLKHVVVYENILDEFKVGQCEIKVKVTIALAMFNHLIFQIISRWLFIADSGKSYISLIMSGTLREAKLNVLGICLACRSL